MEKICGNCRNTNGCEYDPTKMICWVHNSIVQDNDPACSSFLKTKTKDRNQGGSLRD